MSLFGDEPGGLIFIVVLYSVKVALKVRQSGSGSPCRWLWRDGVYSDTALAAVGAAAPVYGLMIGFAGGLTNGFAVIIARYFGANNEREMKKSVALTYILSAFIAVILTIGSVSILHPLMKTLKTPDEIIRDTESYIRIIMLFSVITIAYNMLAGMMRAIGNSKAPLYFLIISTFVNIGLDFLFVKGFDMGWQEPPVQRLFLRAFR